MAAQHGERGDWRSPEVAKGRQEDLGQIPPVDPQGGRGLGDTSVMNQFHETNLLADKMIVYKYS